MVRASRSTDAIVNQFMRAYMRGLRPMLIFVDQNGFSSNWAKLSLFMELYMNIYGPLDVIIMTPKADGVGNSRMGDADSICSVDLDTYWTGFYSSVDIIDRNSRKKANGCLLARQTNLDLISDGNVASEQTRTITG